MTNIKNENTGENRSIDHVPMVSVGLPVFNGENYLREAMESLLAQSFTNFELIVSDNNSTDATPEIAGKYAAADPRIRYFQQPVNIGATKNFEFVLAQARGTFFMWAAHDDVWDPHWLEVLVKEIKDSDICVRGAVQIISDTGIIACAHPTSFHRGQWFRLFMEPEVYYYKNYYIYSLFWKSKLNTMLDSLRGTVVDEVFLLYESVWHGNLRAVKTTYASYRVHPNSSGAQMAKAWQFSVLRALLQVHKIGWYREFIVLTPKRKKVAFIATIPLKHVYAQIHLWWRAFRRLVLRKINIHGLGKTFDQIAAPEYLRKKIEKL